MKRLHRFWWCDEHQEVHEGILEDWNMEHRTHLHPVFAEINEERLAASRKPPS